MLDKRQKGDYNDIFDIDQETIHRLYKPCLEFIDEVERLVLEKIDSEGADSK
jgi:hypothetical protein